MSDKLRLEDLLSTAEAVIYVNARLAESGEPGVSEASFRTHVHLEQYAQLEPIRLGERVMEDGSRRNTLILFTPRLLDEYVANREMNRRHGATRLVARPTAEELAQVFDTLAAVAYVNERIAARGGSYQLTPAMAGYFRRTGTLPHRAVSATKIAYLRDDLDAFAEFLLADESLTQVYDTAAAVAYVNERIAARGGAYQLTPAMAGYYRRAGTLPHQVVGATKLVYLRDDLDAFADFLLTGRELASTKAGRLPAAEAGAAS